jgi:hypothetical protein
LLDGGRVTLGQRRIGAESIGGVSWCMGVRGREPGLLGALLLLLLHKLLWCQA